MLKKKFFEEKGDSPNPLRKIKRAIPHRQRTNSSSEDPISSVPTLSKSSPFSDSVDSDLNISRGEESIEEEVDVEIISCSPKEENMLYCLDFDHDIIITDQETRGENFIGKKITSIRKEALKKSGRATTYLKQVPRNVKNDVESTTQKIIGAVEGSKINSPRGPDDSPRIREDSREVKRKEVSKKKRDITQKLEKLEVKQDSMISQLSYVLGETIITECHSLKNTYDEQTNQLKEENKILLGALKELTLQNQVTIELLQATTKRVCF